jgi:hypothetical protein
MPDRQELKSSVFGCFCLWWWYGGKHDDGKDVLLLTNAGYDLAS